MLQDGHCVSLRQPDRAVTPDTDATIPTQSDPAPQTQGMCNDFLPPSLAGIVRLQTVACTWLQLHTASVACTRLQTVACTCTAAALSTVHLGRSLCTMQLVSVCFGPPILQAGLVRCLETLKKVMWARINELQPVCSGGAGLSRRAPPKHPSMGMATLARLRNRAASARRKLTLPLPPKAPMAGRQVSGDLGGKGLVLEACRPHNAVLQSWHEKVFPGEAVGFESACGNTFTGEHFLLAEIHIEFCNGPPLITQIFSCQLCPNMLLRWNIHCVFPSPPQPTHPPKDLHWCKCHT